MTQKLAQGEHQQQQFSVAGEPVLMEHHKLDANYQIQISREERRAGGNECKLQSILCLRGVPV